MMQWTAKPRRPTRKYIRQLKALRRLLSEQEKTTLAAAAEKATLKAERIQKENRKSANSETEWMEWKKYKCSEGWREAGALFRSYRQMWLLQEKSCYRCRLPLEWNDAVLDCTKDGKGVCVCCVRCSSAFLERATNG